MKQFIKHLLRSTSLDYALARTAPADGSLRVLRRRGRDLHYRTGTSDHGIIYEVLLAGVRHMNPVDSPPRDKMVIVDVGANIGASVVFFKERYPDAHIYAFEPVSSNFEMLKKNIAGFSNVDVMRESGTRLRSLGVDHIDILKIDTEGSESTIISGPSELLDKTSYVVGELHGKRDFALLDHLESQGFDIEAKKSMGKRLFLFQARKRT